MDDKCYELCHGTTEEMCYHFAYCSDKCWEERLSLIDRGEWYDKDFKTLDIHMRFKGD